MAELGDYVNGDGKLDLAVGINGPGNLYILLGNGDGTFGPPSPPYDLQGDPFQRPVAEQVRRPELATGKLDLAVANQGTVMAVMMGNGDGTFAPQVLYPTADYPESIALRDVNWRWQARRRGWMCCRVAGIGPARKR